jgi:spermidine synthase
MRRAALPMFVLSGAAALVFEVALQRALSRAFGVSAFATSTVLAAYMTGLALGAVLFGRAADRARSPLRLYAWLELGVAACAVAMPWLVPATTALFARLAQGAESDAPAVVLGRLALAFAVTLAPTVLMGGTLPAVARALATRADTAVARLYTANVLGAALGAALGAYAFLPALGLSRTLWLGAALNAAAALLALALARAEVPPPEPAPAPALPDAPARGALLAASAWSGLATFAAEVTWFHLLGVVVGASAYAFGLMLAVFLLGLALGSAWVSRQPDARVDWRLFGRVQLAAALAIALTLPLWDRVPTLFLLAGRSARSFGAQELVRALVCVEVLLVPAALLGAVFPLVLRLAATERREVGRAIGGVSAANTLGAVVGALLTGFVLLPALGSRGLLVTLVIGAGAAAGLTVRGRWRLMPVGVVALALLLPGWDLARLASGANIYFRETSYGDAELLWARESVTSGLTTVVRHPSTGTTTMLTNGKFQGNDSGEVDAQRAFTQLPMLLQERWERALLIGVGTGCSLGTLLAQPFAHVEAAELSRDILTASERYFAPVNGGALSNPRLTMHLADGRNLLLLSRAAYDLVSIELSTIWFAGAGDLYNREFYALVRERLAPGGVLQQWVQLHHLTRRDLAVILQSMRAELPHVALFTAGGQGIALASAHPLTLDYPRLVALARRLDPQAAAGIPAGDVLTLAGRLVLDERGVAQLIDEEARAEGVPAEQLVSTDDSLRLEYSTPCANARDELDADALLATLSHLSGEPLPMTGLSTPGAEAHARGAWLVGRERTAEALPLLREAARDTAAAAPLLEHVERTLAPP